MLLIDNSRYSREDDIEYLLKQTNCSCAHKGTLDMKSDDIELNDKKNIREHRNTKNIKNLSPLKGINILSLCSLIVFCFVICVYLFIKFKITELYTKFNAGIETLDVGAHMFLFIFILVNLIRIFTILRIGFDFRSTVDQQDEINETIANDFSHWFYLANFLQLGAILTSVVNGSVIISSALNFISSLFYLKTYLSVKRRQSLSGVLSVVGFKIGISIYMGLSNLLFIFNLMQVLKGYLSKENLEIISYVIHFILFTFVILTIVYLKDQYYVLTLILFLGGILLSDYIKNNKTGNVNKHILIFAVLTNLTFIFSFCRYNIQKDRESIMENYQIEKNNL